MRENNSVASSVCSIICYFFQHRWIFRWLTCIRSMKQVFPDKQGKRDVDVFIFQYSDSSVMEVHSCRASTATKGGWVDSKISRSAASGKKVHLHLCTPSDSMYGAGLNILFINATNYIILTTERSNCINKNRNSFFPLIHSWLYLPCQCICQHVITMTQLLASLLSGWLKSWCFIVSLTHLFWNPALIKLPPNVIY